MNDEEIITRAKTYLQNGLLFDKDVGFDKDNFRKRCNPEVDIDKVKVIIDEVKAYQSRIDKAEMLKIIARYKNNSYDYCEHGCHIRIETCLKKLEEELAKSEEVKE